MRLLMPFTDEVRKLRAQMVFGWQIGNAQTLTLQDTKPLFDLIHPRTMHGREMYHKPGVLHDPFGDFFAMMGADIITYEMNRLDGFRNLPVQVVQKGHAFRLPFAILTLPIDLT